MGAFEDAISFALFLLILGLLIPQTRPIAVTIILLTVIIGIVYWLSKEPKRQVSTHPLPSSSTLKCPQCGSKNPKSFGFCRICELRLSIESLPQDQLILLGYLAQPDVLNAATTT